MTRRRRTTPASEVLMRLRREAPPKIHELPKPVDPWPHSWPYTPITAPTVYLPLYEKKD